MADSPEELGEELIGLVRAYLKERSGQERIGINQLKTHGQEIDSTMRRPI